MLTARTKSFAKENGWYQSSSAVFGLYKGYFFVLNSDYGSISIAAPYLDLKQEVQQVLKHLIAGNKKTLHLSEFSVDEQRVILVVKERFTYTRKHHLYETMDFLVGLFTQHNLAYEDRCLRCSSQNDLGYYCVGDAVTILCGSCYSELYESWRADKAEFTNQDKHYLKGGVGSAFVSLLGVALWVVLAIYSPRIASIALVLLGFLAFKGYELFGGKPGRFSAWIIILVNAAAVIVANYAYLLHGLYQRGHGIDLALQGPPAMVNQFAVNLIGSLSLCFLVWVVIFFQQRQALKFPEFKPAQLAT